MVCKLGAAKGGGGGTGPPNQTRGQPRQSPVNAAGRGSGIRPVPRRIASSHVYKGWGETYSPYSSRFPPHLAAARPVEPGCGSMMTADAALKPAPVGSASALACGTQGITCLIVDSGRDSPLGTTWASLQFAQSVSFVSLPQAPLLLPANKWRTRSPRSRYVVMLDSM